MSATREAVAPPRLLVIDDNSLSLRIAVTTLRHAGFEVDDAGSGADGPQRRTQHIGGGVHGTGHTAVRFP